MNYLIDYQPPGLLIPAPRSFGAFGEQGNLKGGFVIKKFSESYEFADLFFIRKIEAELEEREIRIGKMVFKVCSKCGEKKSIPRFSVDKRNLDGRANICKACRSLEGLNYYYHNRGKMLIQNREYLKTNKENRSIYQKNYRKDHKEQLKKNARKWYKSNKKAIKERNLKYYQENKEACQARRGLWIEKNKEGIREYNREYKRKLRKCV